MPIVLVKHKSQIARYCREKNLNLKTSLPGILSQAGKQIALALVFRTQPFGKDEKSLALGVVAATRDIYRVYATPGKAWKDISNPFQASAFWLAVKNNQWDRAAKILNRSGARLKGTLFDNFDGGAQHRQLRNNQGRIPASQKPVMIVKDPEKLKAYVATEAGKVGQGKSGWATCAAFFRGGISGVPGWVTKHNSPGKVIEDFGGTTARLGQSTPMSITMTNQVPYASEILAPFQKSEAVRIAMDKVSSSVSRALQGNGKAPPINA